MNTVEFLKWDSNFFNKKIGQITIDKNISKEHLEQQLLYAKDKNYNIIYLFCGSNISVDKDILQLFNGNLVDTKVIFKKEIEKENNDNLKINSYCSGEVTNEMIELAYLSGEYSRFNKDSRFSNDDFKNLYLEWLRKSVSREIADDVFVYKENKKIVGFVTVSIQNKIGKIGLIAVNSSYQGKNIGTALLEKVFFYLSSKNVSELHIPTQKMNTPACKFYLKNNFKIISEQNIYHFSL